MSNKFRDSSFKLPYGFTVVAGEVVVDEYQKKIIELIYNLRLLELVEDGIKVNLHENDITYLLSKHHIPRFKIEGFAIKKDIEEIMKSANYILKEKLEVKKKELEEFE